MAVWKGSSIPKFLWPSGHIIFYTARNAQVAESLLYACCLGAIKTLSGCVRIACFGLMITSLLQVVNMLDVSWLSRLFIHKLDASCFNNLHQVCKYLSAIFATSKFSQTWCNLIKLVKPTTWIKSVVSLAVWDLSLHPIPISISTLRDLFPSTKDNHPPGCLLSSPFFTVSSTFSSVLSFGFSLPSSSWFDLVFNSGEGWTTFISGSLSLPLLVVASSALFAPSTLLETTADSEEISIAGVGEGISRSDFVSFFPLDDSSVSLLVLESCLRLPVGLVYVSLMCLSLEILKPTGKAYQNSGKFPYRCNTNISGTF